ncbi:hypothetical protein DFH08DRAFT_817927 [Mycena albidolilacea]|uniref:Secreted protein n=1 Tax=Mycena albidolilacea TaxID=1033008 RepID=A0AAD6ZIA1_9AGAR|nr:hypothetical protein DFH08DRAFT_817927 [Mycena albidolilacea]
MFNVLGVLLLFTALSILNRPPGSSCFRARALVEMYPPPVTGGDKDGGQRGDSRSQRSRGGGSRTPGGGGGRVSLTSRVSRGGGAIIDMRGDNIETLHACVSRPSGAASSLAQHGGGAATRVGVAGGHDYHAAVMCREGRACSNEEYMDHESFDCIVVTTM